MPNSPRLGFSELVEGQDAPETTVNLINRYLEQMASRAIVLDKDLATPPGSPADGDAYIVAGSPTGAWSGWANRIAFYAAGWYPITPIHGTRAKVQDEDLEYEFDGAAWGAAALGSAADTTQTKEMIAGFIAAPSDKSYTIALKMAHGGTITETVTKSASGTCTATFKVNSTALGGTANSVSSAEDSEAHASTNTFVAGDDIVLTVSSNSSCADMSFSIKYTRTLD
jgi:hypothetical protein